MSDACDQCGHECQEIARLAVQNNRDGMRKPTICLMTGLINSHFYVTTNWTPLTLK